MGVFVMNNKFITTIGSSEAIPTTIGGLTIGDSGTGIYAGFTLSWGDDFWSKPTMWNGGNIDGAYACSPPYLGFRRVGYTANTMIYLENSYRGARSQSPTDLKNDTVTFQGGVASITAKPLPAGLLPYMPTTYTEGGGDANSKPQILSGALCSWPSFMYSAKGNFIVEGKMRVPSGIIRGFWPSLWVSTFNWPDYGEFDFVELKKDAVGVVTNPQKLHLSDTDGGADVPVSMGAAGTLPTTRFVHFVVKKSGTTITTYDDITTEGTLAVRGTYTNAKVDRLRGAHHIKAELAVDSSWDASAFTIGDYPATVEYDWIRAWCPTGSNANTSLRVVDQVNTTAGGSWNYTIPSDAILFNGASPDLVEVYAAFDNADAPGCPTKLNRLPGGMTVNMTTRTVTGTVPSTEGGRVGLLFLGSYNAGGAVSRSIVYFNVAPVNLSLFGSFNVALSGVVSKTIAFTDFHSGNLNHTYTVTKTGGTWLTITGNGTSSVSISGTAPATEEVVTLNIACVNSIGQTTTITRTATVTSAFDILTWTDAIEWFDASDNTTVFSDNSAITPAVADSSLAGALVGKKIGATLNNPVAGTVPDYVTDATNGLKSIKFTRASVDRLRTNNATIVANVTGNDNAYAIVGAFKRGTAGVSVAAAAFIRDDAVAVSDYIRHYFGGTNTVGVTRTAAGVPVTQGSSAVVTSDSWYTVSWVFSGTTLTVRVDGVEVASALAVNTLPITITDFVLGGLYINTTDTWDGTVAFDGAFGECILIQSIASSDANLAAAEAYLMAKWHN